MTDTDATQKFPVTVRQHTAMSAVALKDKR
jgi:hypothetical protein